MHLFPKVRTLTAEEITHVETQILKSLNNPSGTPNHPIIAQSGRPAYYIGKIIDVFLLPIVRELIMYMGQPALHTTVRITPDFF